MNRKRLHPSNSSLSCSRVCGWKERYRTKGSFSRLSFRVTSEQLVCCAAERKGKKKVSDVNNQNKRLSHVVNYLYLNFAWGLAEGSCSWAWTLYLDLVEIKETTGKGRRIGGKEGIIRFTPSTKSSQDDPHTLSGGQGSKVRYLYNQLTPSCFVFSD